MSHTLKSVADGEWSSRTLSQEGLVLTIDGIGTKRNICTAIGSGAEIANTSAKMVSVIAGGIVPIFQIIGGLIYVASAAAHTIPNAHAEYNGARLEYSAAALSHNPRKMQLAAEGIAVARMGLTNQYLYGTVGSSMTSCGVLTLMSPTGAGLFGFTPVVAAGAAASAGAALGGVYAVRGAVVIGRSLYNLKYLNQFEKELKENLKLNGSTKHSLESSIDNTIQMIKKIGLETHALKRRIGDTAQLGSNAGLDEKIRYLEAVDKGLHEKKLQQKLNLIIGIAMFLGGLAAITAIILSGGLAIPIIALVSAVFFTAMEGIFLAYDSSRLFEKLRKKLYTPSKEIESLKKLHNRIKKEPPAMILQPKPASWSNWIRDTFGYPRKYSFDTEMQALTAAPRR